MTCFKFNMGVCYHRRPEVHVAVDPAEKNLTINGHVRSILLGIEIRHFIRFSSYDICSANGTSASRLLQFLFIFMLPASVSIFAASHHGSIILLLERTFFPAST